MVHRQHDQGAATARGRASGRTTSAGRCCRAGELAAADRGDRDPRPDLEPDDLREGDRRRQRLRRADRATCCARARAPREIFEAVAVEDIRDACDLFRPLYDASDGRRRLLLDRGLAGGGPRRRATRARSRRLWDAVDRPEPDGQDPRHGRGGAGDRGDAGRGHQHQHHPALLDRATTSGWPAPTSRRWRSGWPPDKPIDRIASVASFFVSRVDTAGRQAARREDRGGGDEATKERLRGLKGKVAVANAKLAYAKFQEIFDGERFARLRGGRRRRSSGRSGPAPAPRTRPTATSSTSRR